MPVADYATYCRMIDSALAGKHAYPAINVPWRESMRIPPSMSPP